MNEAPFSMSIPMIGISLFSTFAGAMLGGIFFKMGFNGYLAGALCGFLPQPINSLLRVIFGSAMAHAAGAKGKAPYAFSAPVRYLISAIVSLGVAAVILKTMAMPVNIITGMFIALITTCIVAVTMAMKVSITK